VPILDWREAFRRPDDRRQVEVAGFLGPQQSRNQFAWVVSTGAEKDLSLARAPISPVPLPCAGLLLPGGLAALVVRRRV
jgi:hypothetical protein